MIHFGTQYEFIAAHHFVPRWVAYQGDLDRELSPKEFYAAVGRPDLVRAYEKRRRAMISSVVAGGILTAIGLGVSVSSFNVFSHECKTGDPEFDRCSSSKRNRLLAGLAVSAAGSIGLWIGYWLRSHPHPIDENDAKRLADAYNQRLRGQLGLPVVVREPLIRDLRIAPLVSARDGGLMLRGRF